MRQIRLGREMNHLLDTVKQYKEKLEKQRALKERIISETEKHSLVLVKLKSIDESLI